jgi:mRNA interferase YafQ
MLKIQITTRFKRDLKKFKHNQSVIRELDNVLKILAQRKELPSKYQDHNLSGNWNHSRDCHLKPDTLLIYRVDQEKKLLVLLRIGSHSELFKK